ncbi:MAG TPA: UDP-3-O-(3-hydroxymyristoyl)glucosamine N-acyltransferase [Casimicrobiaceae bacterium]|nr:UDP-3-O-(3-hydroxymyristoyl)glucosamine N-acyltransferase [Casimicrobiaceae bacterium]
MSNSQDARGIALRSLAEPARAELVGDGGVLIDRVATLDGASAGAIAFLANPRYRHQLKSTRASAVIIEPRFAADTALPKLVTSNPYAAYARVAALFHPPHPVAPGVHPTALVAASAHVAASATIGPWVVIGERASIGERTSIHAGCAIGEDCSLGDDIVLHPRVVLYARTVVGARTLIHSGAVLGADGFGMADDGGKWLKVPQLGRVVVGADVEIGANTTIDRGAIDDTVIEDDVKLDNQIQIGHNCRIGAHTAIAGCVGIAGSVRIGRNCQIGGAAMITGHLEIADGTAISAASGVFDTIDEPGLYTGAFPSLPHREWQHVASIVRRLRSFADRIRALERDRRGQGE